MSVIDPLLKPFHLKGLTLRNRIVSTPHAPAYAEDGMPKLRYQLYHEEKAKGGIGMTMFGGSSTVGPDSPSVFGQLNAGTDEIIPWFRQFADRIHAHDTPLICQISHLGRRTTWNDADWLPVVAPSRVREPAHRGFPKEMDVDDIQRIVGYYAAAALRCKEGGLDGVEVLHNTHLPGQFMSPDTNLRTDEYGGSLENRLRFSQAVHQAVREAVGPDFVVGARVEMDSKLGEGLQPQEALTALKMIEETGNVDFFNLNVGRSDTEYLLASYAVPAMHQTLAPWLQMAGAFSRELSIPTIHACRITDIANARFAISEGLLDMVGMTRSHIADPHLVNKLAAGREDRIRPCVGAGYCIDRIYGEGEALCIHNVATGREQKIPHLIPARESRRKKVVVVGGGPAGMEAARVSAERGHEVVLFEASGQLGGQIRLAAMATVRRDIAGIADWLASEVQKLDVDIRWDTLAEAGDVTEEDPDIAIIATGGVPDLDFAAGGDLCLSTWDVLSGGALSGDVLVYDDHGQHQAASTVAQLTQRQDVSLTLVTPDRHACAEMGASNFPMYQSTFLKAGVSITPDYRLIEVTRVGNKLRALFRSDNGGVELERLADHIVVEHGTLPMDGIYHDLRQASANDGVIDYDALIGGEPQPAVEGLSLYRVGDAVASRNIHAAILDSRRLCQTI